MSNSDKICFVLAELHEDDDKKFKIETGCRISICRCFFKCGSGSISAMDWDRKTANIKCKNIWSKFVMPIALDLPRCHTWPNQTPEVDLRRYGRHFVKSIWRHNSVGDHLLCIKFGGPVQNRMPMAVKRSKSKPELEFQDGGRFFRNRK